MANEEKQEPKRETPKEASAVRSIREAVAARLAEAAPEVRDGVISTLSDKEIRRRADAVLKGLELEDQQNKEIRKLENADLVTYDVEGNKTSENFSKQRIDELKKARERRQKTRNALERALAEKPDFQKLFEVTGGGKTPSSEGGVEANE